MFKRLLRPWAKDPAIRQAEAHLARILERMEAAEARASAWADRIEIQLRQLNTLEISLGRLEHQQALSHPRFCSPLRLERFGRKIFSQHDEDGIIAEIFRRIGEESRIFVEIAAGDGRENCSAFLLSQGWRGLWVECNESNVASIYNRWPAEIESKQLKVIQTYINRDNVNQLISDSVGSEIDLLVMDIDGNDYHVLKAIESLPRVICAEYFAKKPPPISWFMQYDEQYDLPMRLGALADGLEYGASLQAWDDLLSPRGYSLVGTSIAGANCFFVRSDLAKGKFEEPFTAYNHFNPVRYWYRTTSFLSQIWNVPPDAVAPSATDKFRSPVSG